MANKGWRHESRRHSLAARGIKTGRKERIGTGFDKRLSIPPNVPETSTYISDDEAIEYIIRVYDVSDVDAGGWSFTEEEKDALREMFKNRERYYIEATKEFIKHGRSIGYEGIDDSDGEIIFDIEMEKNAPELAELRDEAFGAETPAFERKNGKLVANFVR